ncbi:MAG: hypothetical protein J4F28_02005 [Nitrosopumilaceae archaeon]|nr:hypothetical protein [Nitrosopumilaceae archaeon]
MSKSSNSKTVLVAPGNTVGAAVRHAGMSEVIFAPSARRGSDVRPQGRPHNEGCPKCGGTREMEAAPVPVAAANSRSRGVSL